MNLKQIEKELFRMQDKDYAVLQQKIIPAADPGSVIGVRTPELRSFAKVLYKDEGCEKFLKSVPHKYFDENQLHAFVISLEKDFDKCVQEVEEFLPYVDNWATCDQMSPKVFKKDPDRLLPYIKKWIKSDKTYTVRFAIGMLMEHFLGDNFLSEYADMVAVVCSEEYYVNMMRAWYFATALAKQYDAIIPYVENKRLDDWTHNKTIQKSIESYRITDEQKKYLRSLKVGRRG
ncbi:MAG: DNA alkylation repair protein [Clostridiales bacterium]|nr:DNA alkylation repair protein [Clostridiales bacterium]